MTVLQSSDLSFVALASGNDELSTGRMPRRPQSLGVGRDLAHRDGRSRPHGSLATYDVDPLQKTPVIPPVVIVGVIRTRVGRHENETPRLEGWDERIG
jgi:hypothetical protein